MKIGPMRDIIPFLLSGLKRHREVGSVIPSSRWAVHSVCKKVKGKMRQVVVEFGPGTGPYSRGLLKEGVLTPDSKLILVDTNEEYIGYLRKNLGHDPRVTIVHDTAENVRSILRDAGEEKANLILSGLPYSYLDETTRDSIVYESAQSIGPEDRHIVYQVTEAIEPALHKHFGKVDRWKVFRNFPPLNFFEATQPKQARQADPHAKHPAFSSAPRTSASRSS